MKTRRSVPESALRSEGNREARAQLVAALRAAGPDLEGAATIIAREHEGTVRGDGLADARKVLLARLYRRSNDFGASTALKALETFSFGVRPVSFSTV